MIYKKCEICSSGILNVIVLISLQLLVIYFSDSSYKSLLVPGGITANQVSLSKPNQTLVVSLSHTYILLSFQVLKLDQVASKLNRLNCFDPGLFLRRHEDGKGVF